jgi:hypothetical protein
VINELLPDPEGSDAGREFVELLNTGPSVEALAGVRLEFGNGTESGNWIARWSAFDEQVVAAGERFLIVDRNWQGPAFADAEVYLGLQNGPDAVRLVRGETVLDLVGYGALTDGAMMETSPAAVAAGLALARKPDGRDTGDNSRDFQLAPPTPGEANFLPFALEALDWDLEPPSADRPGIDLRLTVTLLNAGTEDLAAGDIFLVVADSRYRAVLDGMPANDVRSLTWNFSPEKSGQWPVRLEFAVAASGQILAVAPTLLQVGPAALVLNEVLGAPDAGQGEWIELAVPGRYPVDLGAYCLRDEDGDWRPLGPGSLWPGDFLVLAQDSSGLAAWQALNEDQGYAERCPPPGGIPNLMSLAGWPSLNNSPPESRDFADRIYLGTPEGAVLDHVTMGGGRYLVGADVPEGVSLERIGPRPVNPAASNWAASTAMAGGTPGCANSLTAVLDSQSDLQAEPRILDRAAGRTAIHLHFLLADGQRGWELRIYDLEGSLVKDFGGEIRGPGPRQLIWDGRDDMGVPVSSGAYVGLLETRDGVGGRLTRTKILLGVR